MRLTLLTAIAAAALLHSAPSRAQSAPDCPLATEPYSADTPLADLLMDAKTREVIQAHAPMLAAEGAGKPGFATVPGAGVILNVRTAATWLRIPQATVDAIDEDLKSIPVTPEASRARCARYDHAAPTLDVPKGHPVILVFGKVTGFKDEASFNAAQAALTEMAKSNGWKLVFTDNGAAFNARDLARFDAVVWNNVSGDVLTVPQETAFRAYIENGGGFVGLHGSGGDPFYVWKWYRDDLIGAEFIGHPRDPQFQAATLNVENPADPLVAGLKPTWNMTEEWYSFKASPRISGAHILLSLDEKTYAPGNDLKMGDHPVAWTRCVAKGRAFYTAIGHLPQNYQEPNVARLIENGANWAAGVAGKSCDPT